jgi:ABC-type transport system involved in multi-copper enzyme maturation permease subunit
MRRALSVARTDLRQVFATPALIVMLAVAAAFGIFVAGPLNTNDYSSLSDWWVAGQGAWIAGQFIALVTCFFTAGALASDVSDGRLEMLVASRLEAGEYLLGRLGARLALVLGLGVVVVGSVAAMKASASGSISYLPFVLAYLAVFLPSVVFATVVTACAGLITGRPRIVTMTYAALWLVTSFPFSLPRGVQALNVVGTVTYGTFFEFGDAAALAPVPVEMRAELLSALAADRPLVAVNLALIAIAIAVVTVLATRYLRRRWDGAATS